MRLIFLFVQFFKIGLFSIGGGLATLPFLFDLANTHEEWLSRILIGDMLAVAQSLPGAIGVNLSAYAGFRYAGIAGAYLAALGLVTPSIIIIIIIARMLGAFKKSALVGALFAGFRPAAAGLLSAAAFAALAVSLYDASAGVWYRMIRGREALLFLGLFFLILKLKKHPVLYIALAGAAGIILGL